MATLSVSALLLGLAVVPPAVGTTATGDKDWFLSNSFDDNGEVTCTYGVAGDGAVSGDWDGNGTDTLGVFRDGTWSLTDSCGGGAGDLISSFGDAGDIPVVGDWDGNGTDTPGVFREGFWYLSDSLTGEVDHYFPYGDSTDTPVVGDWNGDGRTTVGTWSDATWHLTDSLGGGVDHAFTYGATGDSPVAGDWNGDGSDTPGVVSGAEWSLSDVLGGTGDHNFVYGVAGDQPVPGDWDGNGTVTAGIARNGADQASLTAEAAAAAKRPCDERTGFEYNQPTGTPYRFGGGAGYPDVVAPSRKCVKVVSTKDELVAALAAAADKPGSVVYVKKGAKINLTGAPIHVPSRVTLASGRGRNGKGALLKTTEAVPNGMISAAQGARITGLRIKGHNSSNCAEPPVEQTRGARSSVATDCLDSRGIVATGPKVEIDNSEIFGWTYAGIALKPVPDTAGVIDTHIHHNFFHNNRKQKAGYGIVLDGSTSDALIEWNRFNKNRHAVAGNGAAGQSYEARHNLVLSEASGHIFDMHDDPAGRGTPTAIAGTTIKIHDNYILHTRFASVLVRGIPTDHSWTYANCIARPKKVAGAADHKKHAIAQVITTTSEGGAVSMEYKPTGENFSVDETPAGEREGAANRFNQTAKKCGVAKDLSPS